MRDTPTKSSQQAITFMFVCGALLVCVWPLVTFRYSRAKLRAGYEMHHQVSPGGALLIVEPRNHTQLKTVVEAFYAVVPISWTLYVVHSAQNAVSVAHAVAAVQATRRVVLVDLSSVLPYANLTSFGSGTDYNKLFKSTTFWNNTIPEEEEHVLVFQTDSMPCTSAPLNLTRFGGFGYIGCMSEGDKVGPAGWAWFGQCGFYGIGGLSLRRRSFMLDCLHAYPDPASGCPDAEDVTFSSCDDVLSSKYGSPPTMRDVCDFCGQHGWGNSSHRAPQSWGSHKVIMSHENLLRFKKHCPAAMVFRK